MFSDKIIGDVLGSLELEGFDLSIALLEIDEEAGSSTGVAKTISGDRILEIEAHETIGAESGD